MLRKLRKEVDAAIPGRRGLPNAARLANDSGGRPASGRPLDETGGSFP
jgi:hypothetical protein